MKNHGEDSGTLGQLKIIGRMNQVQKYGKVFQSQFVKLLTRLPNFTHTMHRVDHVSENKYAMKA